ncbi:DNA mismatch repair endonuclease MutH [Thaumasiovibrio subtropicus]|uniref:DNA mismatch repair endonuclease MutH n=1 Tax=Thaumasiovibrio subtropicus TaxID=1891207 RepID=UPI000B34C1B7|nr:DNA mismatch repair endonuclease MutH [Thaumasiovibrio subtropicus]
MQQPLPPQSENELLQRAWQLAGLTLGELAAEAGLQCPQNLRRDKGWVGQLLEWHLGAEAGSRPVPDFEQLGIELKTIPISHLGKPLETTFVCVAPLVGLQGITWQQCHLKHKLARVLWIPVEGEREIAISDRRVGSPLLWSPSAAEELALRRDWEELIDKIVLGDVENITARDGEVLQLRPKAANGKALTDAYGKEGQIIQTRPRGFYLKTQFTADILSRHFIH